MAKSYGSELTDLLTRTDASLKGLEDGTIATINKSLKASYLKLEEKLQSKWSGYTADAQPNLLATQRALLLADQLKDQLILLNPQVEKAMTARFDRLLTTANQQGETLAGQLLTLSSGEQDAKWASANIPIEAVASQAKNASTTLAKHSQEFAEKASVVVQQGMIQGWGAAKTAKAMAEQLGILLYQAERIVRTESMNAYDNATRSRYKANDVTYVMRVATGDAKVCGSCAARAGQIYEIDKAPAVIHPNDRCTNVPVKKEWVDAGLVDLEWAKGHAKDTQARTQEKLTQKGTNFEKGKPPTPLWNPEKGFINGGLKASPKSSTPATPAKASKPKAETKPKATKTAKPKPEPTPVPAKMPTPKTAAAAQKPDMQALKDYREATLKAEKAKQEIERLTKEGTLDTNANFLLKKRLLRESEVDFQVREAAAESIAKFASSPRFSDAQVLDDFFADTDAMLAAYGKDPDKFAKTLGDIAAGKRPTPDFSAMPPEEILRLKGEVAMRRAGMRTDQIDKYLSSGDNFAIYWADGEIKKLHNFAGRNDLYLVDIDPEYWQGSKHFHAMHLKEDPAEFRRKVGAAFDGKIEFPGSQKTPVQRAMLEELPAKKAPAAKPRKPPLATDPRPDLSKLKEYREAVLTAKKSQATLDAAKADGSLEKMDLLLRRKLERQTKIDMTLTEQAANEALKLTKSSRFTDAQILDDFFERPSKILDAYADDPDKFAKTLGEIATGKRQQIDPAKLSADEILRLKGEAVLRRAGIDFDMMDRYLSAPDNFSIYWADGEVKKLIQFTAQQGKDIREVDPDFFKGSRHMIAQRFREDPAEVRRRLGKLFDDQVDILPPTITPPKPAPTPAKPPKTTKPKTEKPKPVATGETPLEKRTVADLRKLAKDRGIAVPSKAKKADILGLLQGDTPPAPKPIAKPVAPPTGQDLNKLKVADLKALAKERGIKIPTGAKKADIVGLLNGEQPPAIAKPPKTAKPKATGGDIPLDKRTVADLKKLAKERGVTIPKGAKKADIVALLNGEPVAPKAGKTKTPPKKFIPGQITKGNYQSILQGADDFLADTGIDLKALDEFADFMQGADDRAMELEMLANFSMDKTEAAKAKADLQAFREQRDKLGKKAQETAAKVTQALKVHHRNNSGVSDKKIQDYLDGLNFLKIGKSAFSPDEQDIIKQSVKEVYELSGGFFDKAQRPRNVSSLQRFKHIPEGMDGRAGANHLRNEIEAGSKYVRKSVIMHEVGHFVEYATPQLSNACYDYLESRAKSKRMVDIGIATGIDGMIGEKGMDVPGLYHPYVAKIYGPRGDFTEVVSMGVEKFVDMENLAEFYAQDKSHFRFVLGALL